MYVLLCRKFLVLVGIAFIIAAHVTLWGLHRWLEGYAFRTGLSWWVFILPGLLTLLVALVTITWQSFKAVLANPAFCTE